MSPTFGACGDPTGSKSGGHCTHTPPWRRPCLGKCCELPSGIWADSPDCRKVFHYIQHSGVIVDYHAAIWGEDVLAYAPRHQRTMMAVMMYFLFDQSTAWDLGLSVSMQPSFSYLLIKVKVKMLGWGWNFLHYIIYISGLLRCCTVMLCYTDYKCLFCATETYFS